MDTKMMMKSLTLCAVLIMVLLLGEVGVTKAVTCSPMQLVPCANAITSSTMPSAACCSKLKEQRPCLCNYMKNPNLQKFISSPNAKKVAITCGSPFPNC